MKNLFIKQILLLLIFFQINHLLFASQSSVAEIAVIETTAEKTIAVGILHSLSGTMSISEQVLKDVALMTIDEINHQGGVLNHLIEPIVLDPASNLSLYQSKTEQLINKHQVAVIFGGWTSSSRKQMLPVVEKLNSLLFYPVQYEGQELSTNIFYTGAAPNQQAIPALDYFINNDKDIKRFVLLGSDYIYPRTTNKILRAYLKSRGINSSQIKEVYTPLGEIQYETIINDIKRFSKDEKSLIVSTINGDSNVAFYQEFAKQGLNSSVMPIVAFSIGEQELQSMDKSAMQGHFAVWNYFMSLDNATNISFKQKWKEFAVKKHLPHSDTALTNDPMEATYIGIHLWKQAVEQAQSFAVNKVIKALSGQSFNAPCGYQITMDKNNHHLHKPVFVGQVLADGQFKVVWESKRVIPAEPWSHYIKEGE